MTGIYVKCFNDQETSHVAQRVEAEEGGGEGMKRGGDERERETRGGCEKLKEGC